VILKTVARASEKHKVAVDCVAYGDDLFVDAPHQIAYKEFPGFVARRTEGMAAAMLLSNLISHYCPYSVYANTSAWIPPLKTGSVLKHLIPSGSIETVSLESCLERPKK
jgi:hypothetical protein